MRGREARAARSGLHVQFGGVRRISALYKLTYVELAGACRTILAADFVFKGCLVAEFYIKVAYAHIIGGCDCQAGEVGTYTRHIFAARNTVAQPSGILVNKQLTRNPVGIVFGPCYAPELCQIPESAPNCIGVIVVVQRLAAFVFCNVFYTAVVGRIRAVNVAGQSSAQQGMEQTGIEFHAAVALAAFHTYAAKCILPFGMGILSGPVECQPGSFGFQVQARVFHRGVRQTHLYVHIVALAGIESKVYACSRTRGRA